MIHTDGRPTIACSQRRVPKEQVISPTLAAYNAAMEAVKSKEKPQAIKRL
jgi:hypothetical protein